MHPQPNVRGHLRQIQRKRRDGVSYTVWYAKYRTASGQHRTRKIGPAHLARSKPPAGYLTKNDAAARLEKILTTERAQAALPSSDSSITFGVATAEWLRYVEHDLQRAQSTIRDYRGVAEQLKGGLGADTPLRSITTHTIDDFRERSLSELAIRPKGTKRPAQKVSRRTVQKRLVLLHGILARAVRKGWIPTNPASDAERVSVKRSGDFNVLDPQDVELLANNAASTQDAAIYTVAAFTGLRMGELRALRWRDADFALHLVHVRRNLPAGGEEREPKSGKVRSVPLNDQAAKVLDGLSRRGDFVGPEDRVFVNTVGDAIDDVALRRRFYKALEAAGLGHLRKQETPMVFHDLRHTFGTLAVQAFALSDVKAYMGHADIATTMIYVHHVPQADAADRLTALARGSVPRDVPRSDELEHSSEQLNDPHHA